MCVHGCTYLTTLLGISALGNVSSYEDLIDTGQKPQI